MLVLFLFTVVVDACQNVLIVVVWIVVLPFTSSTKQWIIIPRNWM